MVIHIIKAKKNIILMTVISISLEKFCISSAGCVNSENNRRRQTVICLYCSSEWKWFSVYFCLCSAKQLVRHGSWEKESLWPLAYAHQMRNHFWLRHRRQKKEEKTTAVRCFRNWTMLLVCDLGNETFDILVFYALLIWYWGEVPQNYNNVTWKVFSLLKRNHSDNS